MRTMQMVIMVARVAADPDMRFLPDGRCVTRFTVATDRLRPAEAPETAPATDWHRVVCWEKLGQVAGEYLRKGRLVYVEGRINYRSFETRDGQTRYLAEIVAGNLLLLDRPPAEALGAAPSDAPQADTVYRGSDGRAVAVPSVAAQSTESPPPPPPPPPARPTGGRRS
jgi:single-strand DNA-binding protein